MNSAEVGMPTRTKHQAENHRDRRKLGRTSIPYYLDDEGKTVLHPTTSAIQNWAVGRAIAQALMMNRFSGRGR
jgi:hypothetical protein